ncbi:hypothetical protein cyc_05504 [Cyclospora cayetanensis]|uniref:Uncharacterized protein n=1 Tax=Cyclospora cayetanensis TaxID=88456 RepID=A0A1D3D7S4_9EIME|nr:hypothetical protein cyc_05504 [Cyclospora cayetanensis]
MRMRKRGIVSPEVHDAVCPNFGDMPSSSDHQLFLQRGGVVLLWLWLQRGCPNQIGDARIRDAQFSRQHHYLRCSGKGE